MTNVIPIRRLATVDSTNLLAQRLAAAGVQGPLWIVADEQGGGRGRQGRKWISARGNLYSSYLLPVTALPHFLPQLAFVTALAVHDAVSKLCGDERTRLKWPNDCLLDGGKVAGILCETAEGGQVVIGCGINVEHSPEGLPYKASHLRQWAADVTVEQVHAIYQKRLLARLAQWQGGTGFASILSDWKECAMGLGKPVRVDLGSRVVEGVFSDVAADGALIVKMAAGTTETVHAGDVKFLA